MICRKVFSGTVTHTAGSDASYAAGGGWSHMICHKVSNGTVTLTAGSDASQAAGGGKHTDVSKGVLL